MGWLFHLFFNSGLLWTIALKIVIMFSYFLVDKKRKLFFTFVSSCDQTFAVMDLVERTDVGFRALRKIRVFNGELPNKDNKRLSLVACSSKFGLVFAGSPSSLITLPADRIRLFDGEGEQTRQPEVTDHGGLDSPLPGTPVAVKISCDELTVAVVCSVGNSALMCLLFDVRSLAIMAGVDPFMRIPLSSSPSVDLLDFAFNPVTVNCFVAVLSDGSALMFTAKDDSFGLASLPAAGPKTASCVCWSPKGKQLVLGHSDGKLTQHKPDWTLAKTLAAPAGADVQAITGNGGDRLAVSDVQWISTFVFLVAYRTTGGDPQIHLVLLHAPKAGSPVYATYGDLCFGAAPVRPPMYLMEALRDWGMVACASSNAIEAGIVGKMEPSDPDDKFKAIALDDSSRAEIPLKPDGSEDFPAGLAMDFSSRENIIIGENAAPPAPILLLYSATGLLCPFHFMYHKPGVANLQVAREDIRAAGAPRKGVPQAKPPPALTPLATQQQPAPPPAYSMGGSAFAKPPAYSAAPGFGGAATFGQPAGSLPSASFGGSLTLGQPAAQPAAASPFSAKPAASPAPLPTKPAATVTPAQAAPVPQKPSIPVQPAPAAKPPPQATAPAVDQQQRAQETVKYHRMIKEELATFEKELQRLRLESANDDFSVSSVEVKAQLPRDTANLKDAAEKARKVASVIGEKVAELHAEVIETVAMVQECEHLALKNSDPRYRDLLENRSPGVAISRKIRALRETRRYLQDQLDLARKTLAAELQKQAVLTKGPQAAGNASFSSLMMSMRSTRDPSTIQAFMRKEKDVLRSIAYELDELRARVRRVDPCWGDDEDVDFPSALAASKIAPETPKALRRPMESPRRTSTIAEGFTNAQEATDTLCRGIPQLSKTKLEALWKAYTPRKIVRVRKVEGVKVEGFGLEPTEGEQGKGEATLVVGQSPVRPPVTPVASPVVKPAAFATLTTPNVFSELKRSVQVEEAKKVEEKPKPAPMPALLTTPTKPKPTFSSANGVAAVQRSLPMGVTLTPVTSKTSSAFSVPPPATTATAASAFSVVSTAATKPAAPFGSMFGGTSITPVAAKKEEKSTPVVSLPAAAQATPLSLTSKPADAKVGFSFSLKPSSSTPSVSAQPTAPGKSTGAFSGTGFVLGSGDKKDEKKEEKKAEDQKEEKKDELKEEKKEETKTKPVMPVAATTKKSFAGGSITAGTSIFGVKPASATTTAATAPVSGASTSTTTAPKTPTTTTAFDFSSFASGSKGFSFSYPETFGGSSGGFLKPTVATTTAPETTTVTTTTATSLPSATFTPSITPSLFGSDTSSTKPAATGVKTTTETGTTETTTAPTTTSTGSIFGGGSIFGSSATTTAGSIFGGIGSAKTEAPPTAAAASPFGVTTSAAKPLFGSAATTTAPSAPAFSITPVKPSTPSIFGGGSLTSGTSIFGGSTPAAAATTTASSVFGGGSLTSGTSIFGGATPAAAAAMTPAKTAPSVFGGSSTVTSPFGQAPASAFGTSPFGKPTTEAAGDASKGSFPFSLKAMNTGAAPNVTITPGSSVFGSSSGMFGAATPATTSQPASADSSTVNAFASSFGSGFGLGGTPNAANANKNVFGGGTPFGASSGTSSSIFGGASADKPAFGFGSSSGGGSLFGTPTSAATSSAATSTAGGFGAFSSPSAGAFGSPGGSGAFGQPPAFGSLSKSPGSTAFGGAPAFGSQPAFGSAPGFGSSGGFGSPSVFGSSTSATAGSPTFGALAASSDVPTFGSLSGSSSGAPFGFGGAAPVQGNQGGGFGFGSPGGSVFGGGGFGQQQQQPQQQQQQQQQQQPPSFGGGAQFTSWR